jgi:hypothetical protein
MELKTSDKYFIFFYTVNRNNFVSKIGALFFFLVIICIKIEFVERRIFFSHPQN